MPDTKNRKEPRVAEQFDLVIIGGGNAGYIPAIRASQLGMSVALIEKREGGHLGGTCLNVGCIPTKALLQTAHLLHDARNGEDFGIKVGEVEFDYPQAAKRREQVVNQLRRGVQGLMKKNKVTVYNGVGSFIEPKKIKVETEDGEEELEAENVLISTGSAVNTLPGLEFDHEKIISSDDIVTNDESYPESVIILGSGAVGVEFASMYHDFGTEVTIVEILDRIVPLEDPEISEALKEEFEDRGIRVLTSTKADPESLEKAEDGVYAAGDVVGGYLLAHAAGHEGIIAVEHMAGENPLPMDQNLVPRVTFCRPEVASFGLTKAQAEEEGYEVRETKFPFRAIGKALIEGESNGFFKVVADEETDLILGMHAIGPKVTDLITEGVFAKLVEGTPEEIGMTMHPHPSLSED